MSVAALRSELDAARPRPDIVLRHIAGIVAECREPRWLLHRVLERGVLAVLAGARGTFKSFVALDWTMRVALAGHPAVILSGEGAGLDRRVDAWVRMHRPAVALEELPVLALERPLRLTAGGDLPALVEVIESGHSQPELIVIDTLSKYSAGIDENSNSEVAAYLGELAAGLRDRFDATVLLVAHAGHGDAKRPRGASALMANTDAEYIVERPAATAMTVTVTRERFKDYASLEPLAYAAEVIDLGRADSHGERVTSLALLATQASPVTPRINGRNMTAAATALREWSRTRPDARHISTLELTDLLKAHGVKDRRRRIEVINGLVNLRAITATLGGYTFDPSVLNP
jgi:hypothetical protein